MQSRLPQWTSVLAGQSVTESDSDGHHIIFEQGCITALELTGIIDTSKL